MSVGRNKTIVLGIICGLFICILLLGFWVSQQDDLSGDLVASEEMSYFEKGQYYFNHDSDPAPPYDLALAREYFTAAIMEDPRISPLAWYQLGRIDFLEGKFNSALYKFDKQIEYFGEGGVPSVHYMVGLTYAYKAIETDSETDWENAAAGFEKYLEYNPDSPWARVDLSWVFFSQGKYEEMYEMLQRDYDQFKDNAWYNNMYGLALLNTGEHAEAHSVFQKAETQAWLLTEKDWGNSYPGNDPRSWATGLDEMRAAIEKNVALTAPVPN